jgi:hypothetical protein
MHKPLLPFGFWPGHWGLKGKTREIAKAEYESSTPYELDVRLLEINHGDDSAAMARGKLDLDLKHGYLTDYEYRQKLADIENNHDDTLADIAKLDIDLEHKKITQLEYDRKKADLLEEPWVSMPTINWDPAVSNRTYFQLDYNDYFYKNLLANGYEGTEDEVINKWLNDICISIIEEINGMEAELVTPTRRADLTDDGDE